MVYDTCVRELKRQNMKNMLSFITAMNLLVVNLKLVWCNNDKPETIHTASTLNNNK